MAAWPSGLRCQCRGFESHTEKFVYSLVFFFRACILFGVPVDIEAVLVQQTSHCCVTVKLKTGMVTCQKIPLKV